MGLDAAFGTPAVAKKSYARMPGSVSKGGAGEEDDGQEVDFLSAVVEGLMAAQAGMADGLGACESTVRESVRGCAAELRPLLKPDKLLDAQKHLDDVTHTALPLARELVRDAAARVGEALAAVQSYKRVQIIIRRFALRNVARAFNKWRDIWANGAAAHEKTLASHAAMELLKRWFKSELGARFDQWRAGATAIRDERERKEADKAELEALRTMRLKVVWERMSKSSVLRAYNTWVDACAARFDKLHKRQQAEQDAKEAEAKRKEEELLKLREEGDRLQQERLAAILRRILMAEGAKAWNVWKEDFRTRKRLRNIVKKMKNRGLAMAWGLWVEVLEETREQKAMLKKAAQRMKMAAAGGAFSRWVEMVDEAAEMKALLKKAAMKMLMRSAAMAFDNWASITEEMKEQRVMLRRVAMKMANRGLSMAFDTWAEVVEEANETRAKLRKAAMKMLMRGAATAFDSWASAAEEAKTTRVLLQRVALKMKNRGLSMAWESWLDMVEDIKEQRFKVRRTLNKMLKRAMADCYTEWADYVMELKHGDAEAQRQAREAEVRAERALLKLKNRSVAGAFDRWAEMAEEARDLRFKCQKIVKRIQNMAYAGAWSAWLDMVEEANETRAKLRKAAMKMLMRGAAMAFDSWASAAEEAKTTRVLLQRVALKMKNRGLSMAWESWLDMVEDIKEQRFKVRRTLNKMLKRAMADCYTEWADYVMELKHGDAESQRQAREAEVRAERALLKLKNRSVAGAFDRWAEMAEEARDLRFKCQKIVKRIQNMAYAGAWSAWLDMVEEANETRAKLRKAAMKMLMRGAAMAFDSWASAAEEAKTTRVLLQRVALKMKNRGLSMAWESWLDMVEEAKELKNKLRRVVAMMTKSGMVQAFSGWYELVKEGKENLVKLRRVVQRMRNAAMFKSWACWREHCVHVKLVRNVLKKMMKAKLAAAVRTWTFFVRNQAMRKLKMSGAAKQALAGAEIIIPLLRVLNMLLQEESPHDKYVRSRDRSRVQANEVNNLIVRLRDWTSTPEDDRIGLDAMAEINRAATLLHREFAAMADNKLSMDKKFDGFKSTIEGLKEEPRRHRLRVFEVIRHKLFTIVNAQSSDAEVRQNVSRFLNAMKPGGRFEKKVAAIDSEEGEALWFSQGQVEENYPSPAPAPEIVEEESLAKFQVGEDEVFHEYVEHSPMIAMAAGAPDGRLASPGMGGRFLPSEMRMTEDAPAAVVSEPSLGGGLVGGPASRALGRRASTQAVPAAMVQISTDTLPPVRQKRGSIAGPGIVEGTRLEDRHAQRRHSMVNTKPTGGQFERVQRGGERLPQVNPGRSQSSLGMNGSAMHVKEAAPPPRAESALEIR